MILDNRIPSVLVPTYFIVQIPTCDPYLFDFEIRSSLQPRYLRGVPTVPYLSANPIKDFCNFIQKFSIYRVTGKLF